MKIYVLLVKTLGFISTSKWGKGIKHIKVEGRGELSTDSRIGLNRLDALHVRSPFNPF